MSYLRQLSRSLARYLLSSSQVEGEYSSPSIAKLNEYLEAYPLASLLTYEVFDDSSNLFYNQNSVGFILETAPLTGISEEMLNILSGWLSDNLPNGALCQFLLWASPKIGLNLSAWQQHRSQRGGLYAALAERRAGYLAQGAYAPLLTQDSTLLRDFQLFISISLPNQPYTESAASALIPLRDNLISTCQAIHLQVEVIGIERFLSIMSGLLNPKADIEPNRSQWQPEQSLHLQLIDAETQVQVTPTSLRFNCGETDVRCFSVKELPKHWAQWGMSDLIGDLYRETLRISCPFLLSFILHAPEHDKAEQRAILKALRADQQARSPMARFVPSVAKLSQDWRFVTERLEEGERLLQGFFQVITYAQPGQGDHAESAVKNLFSAKGWKLRKDKYLSLQSWLSCLPLRLDAHLLADLKRFGRLKTLPSSTAANLLPLQGEWKGLTSPRLLLTGRRGQILWWDNFDNVEGNYNVAVVGKSGSGKSVFMQELMIAIVGSGGRAWVIDVGRSFAKTCQMLNGCYIEFTLESNICINPFTFIKDFSEALSMLKPLVAMMAKHNTVTTDQENAYIEQALTAAWAKAGQKATITLVADWLLQHHDKRAKDLGTMLFSYTQEGMYGRFFEGACNLNIDNPLLVLELEELKGRKDLQEVILLVLMYQVTEVMYHGSRQQHLACFIDEAWDLLRSERAGEFTETGCRRARKYAGAFITGTQSVNDYYKTPAAQAAFENSDWLCLLSQKPESIDELKNRKRLHIDGHIERLLKSIKTVQNQYAEIMLYGPPGFAVGRLLLDPFSKILFSSKAEQVAAVNNWQAQGLSLIEAIDRVAKEFIL